MKKIFSSIGFIIIYLWGIWVTLIEVKAMAWVNTNWAKFERAETCFGVAAIFPLILFGLGHIIREENDKSSKTSGIIPTIITVISQIVALYFVLGYSKFLTGVSVVMSLVCSICMWSDGDYMLSSDNNGRYTITTTKWGDHYSTTKIKDSNGKETKIDHWNF